MPLRPAVLGTARLANFRLAYLPVALRAIRETRVRIWLSGVLITDRVRRRSLTIRDVINDAPNSCTFTIDGPPPVMNQRLTITLNSNAPQTLFTGSLQTIETSYAGTPPHVTSRCTAIDDAFQANRRRPFGAWTHTSATTVAQWLITTFAPGFTTTHVQAGLPAISVIFDGSEGMSNCLTQIAKLIGGYWYIEDNALHVFTSEATPPPDAIDDTPLRFLESPRIESATDVSQLRTRVYGKGHGEATLNEVLADDAIIPIADAVMFTPTGGRAISDAQVITYAGVQLGGGGGLVGPGAAPGGGLVATPQDGSGVESGVHDYAVVFVTASGTSLPGPRASVTLGPLPPPSTAPTVGTATAGGSVDTGSHDYQVTFVTSVGETTPSPASASTATADGVGAYAPPSTAPTVGTATAGGSIDTGSHDYQVTFVTSLGETTPGPASASATTADNVDPYSPPGAPLATEQMVSGQLTSWTPLGGYLGGYLYAVTFVTTLGETTPSPTASEDITPVVLPIGAGITASTGSGATPGLHYYGFTAVTANGETTLLSESSLTVSAGTQVLNWSLGSGSFDPRITAKRLYRSKAGTVSPKYLVATVSPATTSYVDTLDDSALSGPSDPATNTAQGGQMNVTSIATGPTGVTQRKLYRTTAGGSTLKLVTTMFDNVTTSYLDNVADGSLGATAPTSNSTGFAAHTVPMSAIAIGPAGTTSRRIYRRFNGAGTHKRVTTLANNTATTYTDTTSNATLGADAPTSNTTGTDTHTVPMSTIPLGGAGTTSRNLYRRFNGAGTYKLVTTLPNNTATTYSDTIANASLGAAAPSSNTAQQNRVGLTSVPVGTSAVTQRQIYRTIAGGSTLNLQQTIADNVTTSGVQDTTPDASLGATAPVIDSSGLAQPEGQLSAGATTAIVAGTAAFSPTGGWAVVGNGRVVFRYTGVTGSSLTGIPASGIGALNVTVSYNQTITAAPALTGVSGLTRDLIKGAPVNIFVQRDDLTAQAHQAVIDTANGFLPADGVYEGPLIVDERRGEASLAAVCDAALAFFSEPIQTVHYASRDLKTKSGKPVHVDLPSPPVAGDLVIQEVTIDQIDIADGLAPRFTVVASTTRYSLDDLLRRLLTAAQGGP